MIVKPSIAQSVERWTVVKQVCNLLVAEFKSGPKDWGFFFSWQMRYGLTIHMKWNIIHIR